LQKTAQLWNKSKEDLASQLADLKTYVAGLSTLDRTAMLTD
jgi:ribosomal protein L29